MAKNKYSRLMFDVSKAPEWIEIWCESNVDGKFNIIEEKKSGRISYTIKAEKEFMIDFLECSGGAYTIQYKIGKNHDISEMLAESIYTRITAVGNNVGASNNFSVKIEKSTYDSLIELLVSSDECSVTVHESRPELGYELHKLKGRLGDSVTTKYFYRSQRIQIQGRPLYLFQLIQGFLLEDETVAEAVVEEQIRYYNIDEDIDEIKDEMKRYFGESLYGFFTKSQQMILHSFFVLEKVEIELPEFSIITNPVFRVLDGFILKLLVSGGVIHDRELVGQYFSFDGRRYVLKPDTCKIIKNENNIKIVEHLYSLYATYRNPYSHTSECDFTTQVIETREKADEIAREVLNALKASHANWEKRG